MLSLIKSVALFRQHRLPTYELRKKRVSLFISFAAYEKRIVYFVFFKIYIVKPRLQVVKFVRVTRTSVVFPEKACAVENDALIDEHSVFRLVDGIKPSAAFIKY